MQVFKSYFKVLRKYIGFIFMYIGIMSGVVSAVMASNAQETDTDYVASKTKFAVFDYDNSEASKAMTDYLKEKHKLVEIANDDKETIQDELYIRNVENILFIPQGFEDALKAGDFASVKDAADNAAALEIVTIPGSQAAMFFETTINNYLNIVSTYLRADFTMEEANARTADALKLTADVTLPGGEAKTAHSKLYMFFNYLAWVLVAQMIAAIGPVLLVYNKKEIRDRIACSSYKFVSVNVELLCGVVVTGFIIVLAMILFSAALTQGTVFSSKGLWMSANAVCYMFVALSLAFLASKLTNKQESLSMISNIISLGMAFLCGIFVPIELLGDGIVKAAHFLPAYWFNQANISIDYHMDTDGQYILMCMGIELLFALLFFILGLVRAKKLSTAQ